MTASRKFDLIVFDWDGTLMDSTGLITSALQAACVDVGLSTPTETSCRQVIGLSLGEALRALVPHATEADHPRIVERYRYHYFAGDGHPPLYAGVADLLAQLRAERYLLAIATGKARRGLDAALAHSGIGGQFHMTRCADESQSKPHPAMLLEIMGELMVAPERTLMIGDTTHDLLMAKSAAVPSVAITHGAHDASALAAMQPLGMVDSIEELAQWLKANA